jgi:FMN phosphatase YigB (HAD superfamily)
VDIAGAPPELLPFGHSELDRVKQLLTDGSCSVLSLDVFDTVLWRRVPRPTDVFAVLAARLRAQGRCPAWVTDASFRQMRIVAEREARARRGFSGGEVSLFDIWRAMPLSLFEPAVLEELVEAEVDLERRLTVVDLDIASAAALARKNNIPVILVSDTYFTEDQFSYLLDRPQLEGLHGVRVFRSHQHGADKASGLWPIVLNDLQLSPEQLVHIGDNEVADHSVPAKLGIRTVHYRRIDDGFARVLEREQECVDPFGPFGAGIDAASGDFGLTSLRAKTLQSGARTTSSTIDVAWRYGASVLGPVLTGFAEWVARRAHTCGIPVVWCPMREGELLARLVNDAALARGWAVEAKPIWLSRQVTSLAALDRVDQESISGFVRRSYRPTVRHLLGLLRLRPGDVPCLADQLDTLLDQKEIVDRVSLALTETPHLRNRLAVTVTGARERLLRALHLSGAMERPELTLVDLGWGGTIQFQLARALRIARTGIAPSGLYLALDERSTRLYQAGLRAEGYLGQSGHPSAVVAACTRSPEVIEQCVNAVCGSLIDFTEDGSPVLGPGTGAPSQDVERQAVQEGILAFQQHWNRYVVEFQDDWPDLTGSAHRRLANILTSALRSPTPEEAALFGNWQHEDNFGSTIVTRIIPDDLVAAIPYLSPNDLDDLHMRDAFWPALLAASDTHLSAAAYALTTGNVDPMMFDPSGDPFESSLHVRTVDNRWHNGPRRRVRINHNGLSFARMKVDVPAMTEAALAIPGRPAIVRIDWIEATVIAGGNPVPQRLRWDEPEDFAGLACSGCVWLGANLIGFAAPRSALVLPLAARAGSPVSSVQVSVAFAMLPQSVSQLDPRMSAAPWIARLSGRIRAEYRTRGVAGVAGGAARLAARQITGRR